MLGRPTPHHPAFFQSNQGIAVVQIIVPTVSGVDAGLNSLSVDVAGTGEQEDGFCFGFTGTIFIFGKIENGLLNGSDDFFGWIIGLGIPNNVGKSIYFSIPNDIGVGVIRPSRKKSRFYADFRYIAQN